MATHRIPILNWSSKPDTSGKVWFENLGLLGGGTGAWDRFILRIDETGANDTQLSTRVGIHGGFTVPKNYNSGAVLVIEWSGSVTSGNKVFDFDYRAVAVDQSLNQSGQDESITVTDAMPGTAWFRQEATISLTSGNFAVDDEVEFKFFEDGADAADTAAAAAAIFNLLFEYTD